MYGSMLYPFPYRLSTGSVAFHLTPAALIKLSIGAATNQNARLLWLWVNGVELQFTHSFVAAAHTQAY